MVCVDVGVCVFRLLLLFILTALENSCSFFFLARNTFDTMVELLFLCLFLLSFSLFFFVHFFFAYLVDKILVEKFKT